MENKYRTEENGGLVIKKNTINVNTLILMIRIFEGVVGGQFPQFQLVMQAIFFNSGRVGLGDRGATRVY